MKKIIATIAAVALSACSASVEQAPSMTLTTVHARPLLAEECDPSHDPALPPKPRADMKNGWASQSSVVESRAKSVETVETLKAARLICWATIESHWPRQTRIANATEKSGLK